MQDWRPSIMPPNKATSFTFGTNVSFVKNDMHSRTMDDGAENNLYGLHSEENKYALFAEGTRSWEMFSASVGLRYEMFKMTYMDKQTQSVLENRTYNRLYPYISCSYSGKDIKMGLSLSTKVKRPSYYQLRNSTEYLNRYAMEMGNPMLLPQYTTGLSYTAKYRSLTFSMDYQWISDYIMSSNIVIQSDPLVSVSKPVNLSHYTAFNAGLSYNTKIGVWEPYLSANLMRTFLKIYNEDGTRANGTRPYMVASFNNYWELKNNWMPYLLLEYDGDGYMREYRIKQSVIVGMGIVKRLFNNALYIRLSIDNLLGAEENEIRYDTNYVFSKKRYRDNRKVGLYIRYTFNDKKKYKGKTSADEEINRM